MALRMSRPRLATAEHRTVPLRPKTADAHYLTPEHRAWAEYVIGRAAGRCEQVTNGIRCEKALPQHRMFADHIVEKQDGGALLDPDNGQCLCGAHHTLKTNAERAKRAACSPT